MSTPLQHDTPYPMTDRPDLATAIQFNREHLGSTPWADALGRASRVEATVLTWARERTRPATTVSASTAHNAASADPEYASTDRDLMVKDQADDEKENDWWTCPAKRLERPPAGVECELKAFQMDGLSWLVDRYERKVNCLLGDEMGLGKTVQSVAFVQYVRESYRISNRPSTPILVICPLSMISSWKNEFARFAPNVPVFLNIGNASDRESTQSNLFKQLRQSGGSYCPVLLTTYELALNDMDALSYDHTFGVKRPWAACIVDEAHRLKSSSSALHTVLRTKYSLRHVVLLTGTPTQNTVIELWSLLAFLAPKLFNENQLSEETFQAAFGLLKDRPTTKDAVVDEEYERGLEALRQCIALRIHNILRIFMLRRTKKGVQLKLPPKHETMVMCGLTEIQKQAYRAILSRNIKFLAGGSSMSSTVSLQNIVASLMKASNHPYLFPGVEPEPYEEGDHLWQASHKLAFLDKLLPLLRERKRKVLIFSTSTAMLDILQDYLTYRNYVWERLDGSVRGEERFAAIDRFQGADHDEETAFVFLLSTRAGGQGLTLTAADTVIFFDSDLNPAIDKQAEARCHRIGQTKPVLVFRLVTKNTPEDLFLKRSAQKLAMTSRILAEDDLVRNVVGVVAGADSVAGHAGTGRLDSGDLVISEQALEEAICYGADLAFREISDASASSSSSLEKSINQQYFSTSCVEWTPTMVKNILSQAEYALTSCGVSGESISTVDAADESSISLLNADAAADEITASSTAAMSRSSQEVSLSALDAQIQQGINAGKNLLAALRASVEEEEKERKSSIDFDSTSRGRGGGGGGRLLSLEDIFTQRRKRQSSGGRSSPGPDNVKRVKKLSDEELAARAEARKAKQAAFWAEVGYVSANLPEPDADVMTAVEDAMFMGGSSDGTNTKTNMFYVFGDASAPEYTLDSRQADSQYFGYYSDYIEGSNAPSPLLAEAQSAFARCRGFIILNAVDNSGSFGRGAYLAKLADRCPTLVTKYAQAADMDDLHYGDAQLVPIDEKEAKADSMQSNNVAHAYICNLIVYKRGQDGKPPQLSLNAVAQAIDKIRAFAFQHNLCVVTPRVGAGTGRGKTRDKSWYSYERIMKNHLAASGVSVFVFYYPRRSLRHHGAPTRQPQPPGLTARDLPQSTDRLVSNPTGTRTDKTTDGGGVNIADFDQILSEAVESRNSQAKPPASSELGVLGEFLENVDNQTFKEMTNASQDGSLDTNKSHQADAMSWAETDSMLTSVPSVRPNADCFWNYNGDPRALPVDAPWAPLFDTSSRLWRPASTLKQIPFGIRFSSRRRRTVDEEPSVQPSVMETGAQAAQPMVLETAQVGVIDELLQELEEQDLRRGIEASLRDNQPVQSSIEPKDGVSQTAIQDPQAQLSPQSSTMYARSPPTAMSNADGTDNDYDEELIFQGFIFSICPDLSKTSQLWKQLHRSIIGCGGRLDPTLWSNFAAMWNYMPISPHTDKPDECPIIVQAPGQPAPIMVSASYVPMSLLEGTAEDPFKYEWK